jgi:hypothetical protein
MADLDRRARDWVLVQIYWRGIVWIYGRGMDYKIACQILQMDTEYRRWDWIYTDRRVSDWFIKTQA